MYYWRRRLPNVLVSWFHKRHLFLSLQTPDPVFARRLVVLLDAKLEEVVTAFEHSDMHMTPPQVDAVLRDVVTKHLTKLERLTVGVGGASVDYARDPALVPALQKSRWWGMLIVETIAWIRREHLVKGKTIREIARDLNISRNTVRQVLRSGETTSAYEREVQPRPKLFRWTEELGALLVGNADKPAREQLTLIQIFEELRGRGYDRDYDAVRCGATPDAGPGERGQSTD